ncbi:uncharacterized protein BT62DRAFT_1009334 [Guyanagaster necrorhizus]|uniref:Uncharacterized protein n=1 Tax=Guyanagaster necrorhizus TaxID=856835 RepID=A0A9P7VMM1_9AGAR|nr:uncharacterized protein BT62DRAFT_1009334 [Guyanagaster necrorhizus MCA 3950]KAG7443514.1 hypothetical protein BT62DRAFT_1009334 [Guyanagaster necrorhizus MCA 3950]
MDCIPQLNDFFPQDELACRSVRRRGDEPPFELRYCKDQMQLGFKDPNSVNEMIFSVTGSLELEPSRRSNIPDRYISEEVHKCTVPSLGRFRKIFQELYQSLLHLLVGH